MENWGWDREWAKGNKWWGTEERTADRRKSRYIESEERQTRTYWAREVCNQALPNHSCKTDETLGVDLMQKERRSNECQVGNGYGCQGSTWCKEEERSKECQVGNALTRREGVRGFGSVLLGHELAQDGARGFRSVLLRCKLVWGGASGFRIGKGCLGMILMTWEWCRQVGIGWMGVGTVMVMTLRGKLSSRLVLSKRVMWLEVLPWQCWCKTLRWKVSLNRWKYCVLM